MRRHEDQVPTDPRAEARGPAVRATAGNASAALRFVTLAEIASGDTARIDLCRVTEPAAMNGRLVAVKRLHPHLLEDRELATMFFDEVWMTASLVHPNVVEVAGWGEDREGPYLAVELLEGVSLARLTKTVFDTGEIFGERMVVFLGSQICRGLEAAHELRTPAGDLLGLVHRDLTPGNVLIGFEGRVKIADFGLAKAKQRITRTVTGLLKGRPQYMAPEQARGESVDSRADLFSLGVLLFELFAGRRPWSGATEFEVLSTTQNDPPADLRELRPKIDRELASVVAKLLEKSPDDRFATAAEVGARLDEWLSVHGWSEGNDEALARFVRRNAMRQMRWFERAIRGELAPDKKGRSRAGSLPGATDVAVEPRASRRERAKRVADDPTELSGAGLPQAFGAPRPGLVDITPVVAAGFEAVGRAMEIGEEIPTLLHGDRMLTPMSRIPSVAPPRGIAPMHPPIYPIEEEETDQRTTAIKGRSPAADAGRPLPRLRLDDNGHDIADPETETLPVKGPRQAAVKAAIEKARSSALPPPRPPPIRSRPPQQPIEERPAPLPSSPPPSPRMTAAAEPHRVAWSLDAVTEAAERLAAAAREAERDASRAASEAALRAAIARRAADLADLGAQTLRAAVSGADLQQAAQRMEEAERTLAAARSGDVEVLPIDQGRQETATFAAAPPSVHGLGSGLAPGQAELAGAARNSYVSIPDHEVASSSFPPPSLGHAAGQGGVGHGHSQAHFHVSHGGGGGGATGPQPYEVVEELRRLEEERHRRSVESATVMSMRLPPMILGVQPLLAAAVAVFGLLLVVLLALVLFG